MILGVNSASEETQETVPSSILFLVAVSSISTFTFCPILRCGSWSPLTKPEGSGSTHPRYGKGIAPVLPAHRPFVTFKHNPLMGDTIRHLFNLSFNCANYVSNTSDSPVRTDSCERVLSFACRAAPGYLLCHPSVSGWRRRRTNMLSTRALSTSRFFFCCSTTANCDFTLCFLA